PCGVVNSESVYNICGFLSDHQYVSISRKTDLRRGGVGCAQRSSGIRQRRQFATEEEKGGHVGGSAQKAPGVEDVEQVLMHREADRTSASRADLVGDLQS